MGLEYNRGTTFSEVGLVGFLFDMPVKSYGLNQFNFLIAVKDIGTILMGIELMVILQHRSMALTESD